VRLGHLHLGSGISGDMFLSVLSSAGVSLSLMEEAVHAVGGGRLSLDRDTVTRGAIRATHVVVRLDGRKIEEGGGPGDQAVLALAKPNRKHPHGQATTYARIAERIEAATLSAFVKQKALETFELLVEAEGEVHGAAPDRVHLHEVGALDAIADVVGTIAGLETLGLDRLYHGPVSVGGGRVHSTHGLLPVPAPATLALLRGRECVFEEGVGELTTPTGAALLVALSEESPSDLRFRPTTVAYGAGARDPEGRSNVVRLTLGETDSRPATRSQVAVIETALDDSTPEEGGYLITTLMEAGALDASLTPLIMKKGRPGFLLRVLVPPGDGADFARRVVEISSSLGARWRVEDRVELDRRIDHIQLPDGEVRVKVAILPDGSERIHPEYEDLARIADKRKSSLARVRNEVEQVWNNRG